jgi:hypothetical protein
MNWLYATPLNASAVMIAWMMLNVNVPMTSNLLSILGASCPAGIIEMLADQDDKRECFEPGIQFL